MQVKTIIKTTNRGFPHSSVGKESAFSAGNPGSIPGSGRSPGGRHGNPLQYSCLENPMDRGAWWATVHWVKRVRHDWVTKTTNNNKCWCGETGTLIYCGWECNTAVALAKNQVFLKRWRTEVPDKTEIPLLHKYSGEMKTYGHTKTVH